ncbi:aldolase [Paenibacillus sp. ATY16]|uniref:aldolase n=1 Tax=Paenibacillus sp. ATY16 TaxID=1759312 RepID=UPI00200E8B6B|nr:aldolase [Paenibacillus sp. ATY16]MCK9860366.1 aldolase [Paenibacillus sp. ATY16]
MEHSKRMYTAYGLRLASEIELPELLTAIDDGSEPDAWITYADLSSYVANWEPDRRNWADEEQVLIYVPGVAYYRVVFNLIEVMPLKDVDPRQSRLYIVGACCSVLLVRRGIVPMHAGGVVIDGKAYAILGDCGAGKSTLGAAFMEAGYKLLSDDIVAVAMNEKTNELTAYPGYPQQKLWRQSLEYFQREASDYRSILQDYDKYAVPITDLFHKEPIPLAGIFELEKADVPQVRIHPLTPLQRVQLFRYHSFLDRVLKEMKLEQWLFTFGTKVALAIPFYQLKRPSTGYTAPELVSEILHTVREREMISL